MIALIIIGACALLVVVFFAFHKRGAAPGVKKTNPFDIRESVRCPPEYIRPPTKKGYCGVTGCANMRPHSHAEDLARRLRERR